MWLDGVLGVLLGGDGVGLRGEADVEGLEGVGFGLAVCAVVFSGGAVDADYVFFVEVCGGVRLWWRRGEEEDALW